MKVDKLRIGVLTFLLGVIGAVLTACSAWSQPRTASEAPTPTPLPTVAALAKPTFTVQRGEVVGQVRFTGRIVPVSEQELFFRINGRVRNIYVEDGDSIQAGQVIADLEGIDDLQRQLSRLDLNLQRAQLYANSSQLSLDYFIETTSRYAKGYEKLLAMKENDLALANLAVQEASLGFEEIQFAISDTLLIAPMDGVLTHLNLRPGREVQGYKTIGTVADVTQLEVSAMTAGIDLDKIAIGMEAFIERSSGLGNTALGSVRRLPIAAALGEEGDDSVRITLADSPLELGYTLGDIVKITVTLEKKENALWLPPQAIRTFESRRFVVVQEGSAQQRVDVKLGIIGEDRVEILEGLTEGQVVVSP